MKRVPGLGHPLHKPVDPRTVRLFQIARETGFYGKYCERMEEIGRKKNLGERHRGDRRARLRARARLARGEGPRRMARAIGLVGHLLEEARQPMAEAVWHQIEEQASKHLKP